MVGAVPAPRRQPGDGQGGGDLAAEIDVRDVLPAISVPTLVLHRKRRLVWPVEGARYIAEHIPGAGSSNSRATTTSRSPATRKR